MCCFIRISLLKNSRMFSFFQVASPTMAMRAMSNMARPSWLPMLEEDWLVEEGSSLLQITPAPSCPHNFCLKYSLPSISHLNVTGVYPGFRTVLQSGLSTLTENFDKVPGNRTKLWLLGGNPCLVASFFTDDLRLCPAPVIITDTKSVIEDISLFVLTR